MIRHLLLTSLIAMVGATNASAQQPPADSEVGTSKLARVNLPAKGNAKLTVSTPAFKPGGDIPFENTQYRGNVFPGLSWTAGPAGTRSYAIIMQDADAMRAGMPILHYHFQVFALDIPLPDDARATYDALVAAMKDHVLASGEVIGLGQVAPPAGSQE